VCASVLTRTYNAARLVLDIGVLGWLLRNRRQFRPCICLIFKCRRSQGFLYDCRGQSEVNAPCASPPILTSPTLAELLMALPAANPFSTMRASLRWYSSEELEDGVTYGGQSWLRRGSVDSFFSALLLRDGDAAGRRKRSSS